VRVARLIPVRVPIVFWVAVVATQLAAGGGGEHAVLEVDKTAIRSSFRFGYLSTGE
jgi:hypothetical protein